MRYDKSTEKSQCLNDMHAWLYNNICLCVFACCVNTSSKRSNIDYTLGYFITLNKPFVQSTHRNIVLSDT